MNELIKKIVSFRDDRNWSQYHNPKDLAISLNLEASELLELFQWKTSADVVKDKKAELQDELADIMYYVLLMCHELGIDPEKALIEKLRKNNAKYPIDKSFGSNKKYTEL
ncbi:nucleotide pyrophosphohydrolase [Paenibacillus pinisoli]|uniref:Nucleotide pyrophosphohydrolase n=1 Tax=Paenibacillus pinisoli TaxID=1276110 RepID=A0A3A6PKJ9_9BACL|nr:nucleotide pyrophosphohydrolase [Paenibacillus pinisoli]RJX40890.1 nucleotide pyrophosphohydrolase [Paenibacillus pinisoli]